MRVIHSGSTARKWDIVYMGYISAARISDGLLFVLMVFCLKADAIQLWIILAQSIYALKSY